MISLPAWTPLLPMSLQALLVLLFCLPSHTNAMPAAKKVSLFLLNLPSYQPKIAYEAVWLAFVIKLYVWKKSYQEGINLTGRPLPVEQASE